MNRPDDGDTAVPSAQILVMPLHAVTEVYGEAGLSHRLDLELRRLPEADRRTVLEAATWAAQLHAGQRRTREPHVNHVLRVALRILCHYRVTDPEVVTAALLHDVVEDQPWAVVGRPAVGPQPREEALAVLGERYGHRVGRLVKAVTHPDCPPGADRASHYTGHLTHSLEDEPWARVLKLSDFTDNGVGIIHTVGPRVHRLALKYVDAVPVLRGFLSRSDTPLALPIKMHIGAQLDRAQQRIDAILGTAPAVQESRSPPRGSGERLS